MHTFNYQKFVKEGKAETADGELKVVRHFINKEGKIYVTMKYTKIGAGLVSQNYNKDGGPINMYGTVFPRMEHINLVNE
jgi:hypothetical protein